MVVVGLTERLLPLPTNVPPQLAVYHLITSPVPPPPPLRVKIVDEPLQIVAVETVAEVGFAELIFIVVLEPHVLLPTTLTVIFPAPETPIFRVMPVAAAV